MITADSFGLLDKDNITMPKKEFERLSRNKNLLEKRLILEEKKNDELNKKVEFNLETIETYLLMKLNQFNKDKDINKLVSSLNHLIKTIKDEKRLIHPKGEYKRNEI